MLEVVLTILGLIAGAAVEGDEGAVVGAFIGFLLGFHWRIRRRLRRHEKQLEDLQAQLHALSTLSPATAPASANADPSTAPELEFDISAAAFDATEASVQAGDGAALEIDRSSQDQPAQSVPPSQVKTQSSPAAAYVFQSESASATQDAEMASAASTVQAGHAEGKLESADAWAQSTAASATAGDDLITRGIKACVNFIRGGNPMVRIGVIVLFFGIAFLAKLAIDANLIPIELRMAAIAGVGIALVALGFRFRLTRPEFALPLQGGGIGVMFLTVFAAYRLYSLLPSALCFGLLVSLVILAAVLAVVQNSMILAALGVAGGFVAPILASSGSGDHVALFSYYLLLNLGIVGIAWFKSWRVLNWLGFMFTFVIGTAWGVKNYTPAHFESTEPFLIAHFILYVGVSVLFALRQPPALRGLVDSTLVFGTPLVTFALQSQLVANDPTALAWSAIGAGAFYIALGFWVSRQPNLRLLLQAFVANGIILASIAVPLALDARWTAVTWSLEGAGTLWIGVRQGRMLPRLAGVLLQFFAGASLVWYLLDHPERNAALFLGNTFLGALTISIAGLFCGAYLYRARDSVHRLEVGASWLLGAWGLCWWYGAGLTDVAFRASSATQWGITLLFLAGSCLAASVLMKRNDWPVWRFPSLATVWGLIAITALMGIDERQPFVALAWVGWPIAFGVQLYVLLGMNNWDYPYRDWLHAATHWLLLIIATWACAYWADQWLGGRNLWEPVALGCVPAMMTIFVSRAARGTLWPWARFPAAYLGIGTSPLIVLLALWMVAVNLSPPGSDWPIDYLPILNPIDIAIGFAALSAVVWWRQMNRSVPLDQWPLAAWQRLGLSAFGALMFLWVNAIVFRTVHFWGGIRFDVEALWRADITQSALAILWSVLGVLGMVLGARKQRRALWIVSASLMGLVVVKLFFVDLANTNTLERVISFVSVGGLMVVVGYFAPVPPRATAESEVSA